MAIIKCPECGAEISDLAASCPQCGAPLKPQNQGINNNEPTTKEDVSDVGMNVLSFIIPVAGLILYFIWKDNAPLKAKACGKWAVRGLITEILLSIFFVTIWPLLFVSALF